MWMATHDNGLAATLYGPSTVSALAGDNVPVKIRTTTDYPFNETIRMTVDLSNKAEFPLHLRIPAWCANPRITVNDSEVPVMRNSKGFARIAPTWTTNDRIELQLPMGGGSQWWGTMA